jgi:hypothetical protein
VHGQVPVAHAYNPTYSGDRNQEGWGLKPASANSSGDCILKIPNTKQGWQSGSSGSMPVWASVSKYEQVWGPEFKLQYHQKKLACGFNLQHVGSIPSTNLHPTKSTKPMAMVMISCMPFYSYNCPLIIADFSTLSCN